MPSVQIFWAKPERSFISHLAPLPLQITCQFILPTFTKVATEQNIYHFILLVPQIPKNLTTDNYKMCQAVIAAQNVSGSASAFISR